MRFTKPEGKKYTDLCIEFDKEFYEPDRNDEKLYGYMCIIFRMLAFKKNFFRNYADYDKFATFASTICYIRFIKKQADGERVKSLLNYAKASLYGLKVMYQNEAFNMTTEIDEDGEFVNDSIYETMKQSVQSDYSRDYMVSEIYDELSHIVEIIDDMIDESPFAGNKRTRRNVRISTMLTLLSQMTLRNESLQRLNAKRDTSANRDDEYYIRLLETERLEEPIVWNLNDSMKPYIGVIVNKVRTRLGEEINETRNKYTLPDDALENIIASAYSDMFPETEGEYVPGYKRRVYEEEEQCDEES